MKKLFASGALKKYLITGLLIWIAFIIALSVLVFFTNIVTSRRKAKRENIVVGDDPWDARSLEWMVPNPTPAHNFDSVLVVAYLVEFWHHVLQRIPVVNSIYSSVKQISDTLFSSSGQAFRKALLVQWPHPGMWTIAFQTGTPGGGVERHVPADCIAVYVPTTPNPTGGYFAIVRRADVIELDMSVDQALKYIISMGVVPPLPRQ